MPGNGIIFANLLTLALAPILQCLIYLEKDRAIVLMTMLEVESVIFYLQNDCFEPVIPSLTQLGSLVDDMEQKMKVYEVFLLLYFHLSHY